MRRTVSAFLGAIFLSVALVTPFASAQQGGSGLQLSPTRSDVSANPGEQKSFSLTLKNITQADFTAKAVLNDFESDNISGTPKILVDNKERTPYSISSMIQGVKDVELKAGETKEVKLSIDVPGNAAPGAYFGAVRYSVVPKTDGQADRQIALNASVAHLVFVEVPGNVTQQIKVDSLKVQKGDKSHSLFFNKPDKLAVSIKNLGNGFSRPFGKVSVNGPFGKEADSFEINDVDPRGIVLPNSSRTFNVPSSTNPNDANDIRAIKGIKFPGKYSATASVAYGNGGEVVSYKTTFWYLPGWFFIALFLGLIALAGAIFFIYKKRFARKPTNAPKVAKPRQR